MKSARWITRWCSMSLLFLVIFVLPAAHAQTELFFDDFEGTTLNTGPDGWTFLTNAGNNGYYTLGQGQLTLYSGTTDGGGGFVNTSRNFSVEPDNAGTLVLETRAKTSSTDGGAWGFVSYVNDDLWNYNDGFVTMGIDRQTGWLRAGIRSSRDQSTTYLPIPGPQVDVTEWHLYRIEVSSTDVKFYIDNELRLSHSENIPVGKPLRVLLDRVSRGTWQTLSIDYAKVTKLQSSEAEHVYIATKNGIFVWSSDTSAVELVSPFPAYEIEISPTGVLYVGNGGVDSIRSGVTSVGIFRIDEEGNANLLAPLPAEDLEFGPDGSLYASNTQGIFRVDSDGTISQVSGNPTSQWAFETESTVITTNGAACATDFGRSTDRIFLSTDTAVQLGNDGGEDFEILEDGTSYVSGQGGIYRYRGELVFGAMPVFDFEFSLSGRLYFGNPENYCGEGWQRGLYLVGPDGQNATLLYDADVNSIEILGATEVDQPFVNLTLVDEAGNPLANYPTDFAIETRNLKYKYRCGGSWVPEVAFQTDSNGQTSLDIACDNWDEKVTVTLNQTSLEQDVTENPVFQAAKVNANLKTCAGSIADTPGGTVAQGGGYWYTHGATDGDGTVPFYTFPGNIKLRLSYNHHSQTLYPTIIAGVNELDFTTTTLMLKYAGDIKSNMGGSWWVFSKPSMDLLPGDYNFWFQTGTSWYGPVVLSVSGCEINGTLLRILDENGNGVPGGKATPACGGSWQPTVPGETDASGYLFAQLPVCTTKVKMTVNQGSVEQSNAGMAASNYTWQTELLRIWLKNHAGAAITDQQAVLNQGGGYWYNWGNLNEAGYLDIPLFARTSAYKFKVVYNFTSETHFPVVSTAAGVDDFDFQTGQVFGPCITQYGAGTWRAFVDGMELMPGTYTFRYPSQSGTVTAGGVTSLTCP